MKNLSLLLTFLFYLSIINAQINLPDLTAIPAGQFTMGSETTIPDSLLPGDRYHNLNYLKNGDHDEFPLRAVKISQRFSISKTEIKTDLYQQFDPDFIPNPAYAPFVTGISWHDANKFCSWLSETTGDSYRLPTEAEWEYVAKKHASKVENISNSISEWCLNWYGLYDENNLIDPKGPEIGLTKVIRGGGLDKNTAFFKRVSNRASYGPNFPPENSFQYRNRIEEQLKRDSLEKAEIKENTNLKTEVRYLNFIREGANQQGQHAIGFRIVKSNVELQPSSNSPLYQTNLVKPKNQFVELRIEQPYYRKREVLPTPSDDSADSLIQYFPSLGLPSGILRHHHSPAMEVMPNGDILMVLYTSTSETSHDVALLASRLKFGSDAWEPPYIIMDFADANDHAPLLCQEADTTRLFWGSNKYEYGFPFQWIESYDYGKTWSEPKFPVFKTPVYAHSAQPINSAFRDKEGNIYVASDGVGPKSVLWRSEDNGKTWIDPKGRTGGRHTTMVLREDGSILGLGGKSSQIDGHMPQSISYDKGETWEVSKTPFIALGPGQRPSILKLKSGRILFVSDHSSRLNKELSENRPAEFMERGCFIAYSDDEGKSWKTKKLLGTQFANIENDRLRDHTLGYAILRQAPNENIHLIATVVHPILHYEFNEAWLDAEDFQGDILQDPPNYKVQSVDSVNTFYKNGILECTYQIATTSIGKAKLDGLEKWQYPNGSPKYQVNYKLGKKTGREVFWLPYGKKQWERQHSSDGTSLHFTFHTNEKIKSKSKWKGLYCNGPAREWDKNGQLINHLIFENGDLKKILVPSK